LDVVKQLFGAQEGTIDETNGFVRPVALAALAEELGRSDPTG
jgi:hypothetical protein